VTYRWQTLDWFMPQHLLKIDPGNNLLFMTPSQRDDFCYDGTEPDEDYLEALWESLCPSELREHARLPRAPQRPPDPPPCRIVIVKPGAHAPIAKTRMFVMDWGGFSPNSHPLQCALQMLNWTLQSKEQSQTHGFRTLQRCRTVRRYCCSRCSFSNQAGPPQSSTSGPVRCCWSDRVH
jgi:hypothetical protein